MTSSGTDRAARFTWLLALSLAVAGGRAASAGPAPVAERVAAEIAGRWGVDAARVELAWPKGFVAEAIDPNAPYQLAGRGTDGWFVLVLKPQSDGAEALHLRAGVRCPARVAAHALAAGVTLGENDVRDSLMIDWGVPSPAAPLAGAGWETRRPLVAGEPLVSPAVLPPAVLHAGDPVRLEWNRTGVVVTLNGVALNAAREGQRLRARVASREQPVSAIATGPGVARIEEGR